MPQLEQSATELRDAAIAAVLDALAWMEPEVAKRYMATNAYKRFEALAEGGGRDV